MMEILNMKLTDPCGQPMGNNTELLQFIERLSKDQELFKRFMTELVEKYTKMMDQKVAIQDSKIANVTSKVTVAIEYLEHEEGLMIR